MRIKLVSDGNPNNTKIINSETGEMLEGVYSAHFITKAGHLPYLIMKVWMPDVMVDIDTDSYEIYMTSNHKSKKMTHKFVPKAKD